MERKNLSISHRLNYLFNNREDKYFAEYLLSCLILGKSPKTTPALWQDVEIFIRYKKRDVWSLDDEHILNAEKAIMIYRTKYILENLKKTEILEILNQFFEQPEDGESNKTLTELLTKKFHAPVDDLFLIQEKRIITKDEVEKIDELFCYPGWIEFDDEANEVMFEKILAGELTDEQADYFLGANDDMKNYDQWFKVVKHVLMTTNDAHLFWIAGDILNIIWRTMPEDEKAQKWFRDQIFEIFWSRVGSIWPMENRDKINFESDENSKILWDAMGWLSCLTDLHERLPELSEDYELIEQQTDAEKFAWQEGFLAGQIDLGEDSPQELLHQFYALSDLASSDQDLDSLRNIAGKKLLPILKTEDKKVSEMVERAIKHTEKYVADIKRERENLAKMIKEA